MQPMHFDTALANILKRDTRFDAQAFDFLKDALDYTVEKHSEGDKHASKHVTASELLVGYKEYALKEFGPMASTLLNEWGVSKCSDVGDMVFLLIEEGMFGKQDSDEREDFSEVFDFHQAFVEPFLPSSALV